MHTNPALVKVPLRLWRVISAIADIQRATVARVNRGHRAYGRMEIVGASTLGGIFGDAVHEPRSSLNTV